MSRECIKCNKKIKIFEKIYENKYCKECYEKIQSDKLKEKEELEEKIKKEEEKKQKEKINIARDYLFYTNYYWVVIENIVTIPFHYRDIFNNSIKNKFEIIELLLDEIIKELPKDFSFNDIKQITTYRKSSKIIHDALKNFTHQNLDYLHYYDILIEGQQYAPSPNYNILDDIDENTILLDNNIILNFESTMQVFLENKQKVINNLDRLMNDCIEKSKNPNKYNSNTCIAIAKEEQLEQTFEIIQIYYFYAIIIVYYIHYNRVVDKIMDNSELYNVYKKLKSEIHNENYIIKKLYPIYISLYKSQYDIIFNDENEFEFLIETIENREKIIEKDDFVNINNSILSIKINEFTNYIDENEFAFKIINQINSNIISYKKYLSLNDVLNIFVYSKSYLDIINEFKRQKAIKEKQNILNGYIDEDLKIDNDLLDYTNITNGYDFENFVANIYKLLGYNIECITSKSGDQGADIIIEKNNIKYAIQVKYYNNPVGNKAIQEVVASKKFYNTDKTMVVTNSTFTPQAIVLANANDVLLIDGNKLDELINQIKNNN